MLCEDYIMYYYLISIWCYRFIMAMIGSKNKIKMENKLQLPNEFLNSCELIYVLFNIVFSFTFIGFIDNGYYVKKNEIKTYCN